MAFVNNYTSLRATAFSAGVNENIYVRGYANIGDGGEGNFYWDPVSAAADNDGTVIQVTGVATGRWRREVDEHYNVKWFGAVNVGNGATAQSANRAAIQNAIDRVAAMNGGTIFFPTFDYYFNATINLASKVTLIGDGMLSTRMFYTGTGFAFDFQPPLNQQEIQGPSMSRMKIDVTTGSGSGVRFNNPALPFNGTMDFVMRSLFRELYIAGNPTISTGSRGIQWTKTFDSHIENCHIECFDINIDFQGCDICSIRNNRIKFTKSAAINLFNANSFGTQTEVSHNDVLPTANGGSVFITNDPDPKFEYNYVEIGGTNTMASIFKITGANHLKIFDNRLEVSAAVAPIWLDMSSVNAGDTVDIRNNFTTGVEMGIASFNSAGYPYWKNGKRAAFTFSGNSRRDGYPFNTQQYQVLSGNDVFSGTPSTDGLTQDNYGSQVRCKNNEFLIPPNATPDSSRLRFQAKANGTVSVYVCAYASVAGQTLSFDYTNTNNAVPIASGTQVLTATPQVYRIFNGVVTTDMVVRVWNADTGTGGTIFLQRVTVTQ